MPIVYASEWEGRPNQVCDPFLGYIEIFGECIN
jgi:hypothetical protein